MTKHSVVNGYQGSSYLHLQIIQLSRKGRYIYKALHIPPEEKSHGVRSGDVGGHCRNTQSVWLEHLNCLSGRGVCRYCLTLRHPWSGAPSCWKIKSEDSSSCNFSINQFCSMIRYTSPFTVPSSKKNGPYTRFFDMAQNTFTLGESRTCSRLTWGFPYACVMIVNFTTYVEGHLIAKNKSNLSSSNLSSISVQNLWRIGLSVSFNCWINCCLYGVNCSHLFKTCQTVADGSWSSQLAMLNDLCELCWKACQTCSTISTEVVGRPVLFAKHKHLLLLKFCMPIQNGMSVWCLLGKNCTKFALNMCPWFSFSIL